MAAPVPQRWWRRWHLGARALAPVVIYGLIALAALVVGANAGHFHLRRAHLDVREFRFLMAAVVAVAGVLATRHFSHLVGHASARTQLTSASVTAGLRISLSILGYLVTAVWTLWLCEVSIGHLLLGGALTGVILAVAAQQSLGNVFAGIVLLLARPFVLGDQVRIRSGALGGILEGTVRGISLTYVTLDTEDGRMMLPNSSVLAAVVNRPPPQHPSSSSEPGGHG